VLVRFFYHRLNGIYFLLLVSLKTEEERSHTPEREDNNST